MTQRSVLVLAVAVAFAMAPAPAFAGAGFTVPSRKTTCGILTAEQAAGNGAGLYCRSSYVRAKPPAEMAGAKLLHSGKGRKISLGSDDALFIDGDATNDARPVLRYGKTFKRGGYTCVSRSSGLTCRRGSHGFFLSRESQRYF